MKCPTKWTNHLQPNSGKQHLTHSLLVLHLQQRLKRLLLSHLQLQTMTSVMWLVSSVILVASWAQNNTWSSLHHGVLTREQKYPSSVCAGVTKQGEQRCRRLLPRHLDMSHWLAVSRVPGKEGAYCIPCVLSTCATGMVVALMVMDNCLASCWLHR